MTVDSGLPDEVLSALRDGRKITAIKRLREQRRIGLKEAKVLVDDYLAARPEPVVRAPARAESGLGRLLLLGLLAALAYAAYRWLFAA